MLTILAGFVGFSVFGWPGALIGIVIAEFYL